MSEEISLGSSAKFHRWGYISSGRARILDIGSVAISRIITIISDVLVAVAFGLAAGVFLHWFLGLFVGVVVLGVEIRMLRRYGLWTGHCPHCSQEISVSHGAHGVHAFDCPICTRRVLLSENHFRVV